jgi:hypothetical protein
MERFYARLGLAALGVYSPKAELWIAKIVNTVLLCERASG